MPSPAVATYLQLLDHAWDHAWESLASALDGVTEEEAAWQHPAYASEAAEADWPAPGTILWQVAHLAHYKRDYAAIVRARGTGEDVPVAPREPRSGLEDERAALAAAHAEQREAIAALTDEDLDAEVAGNQSLRDFLSATIRHDIWHAGQIAVARRLARHR